MNFSFKRILSFVLAMVMVLALVPAMSLEAQAAPINSVDLAGCTVNGLGLEVTKLATSETMIMGGEATASWKAQGNSISASLSGALGNLKYFQVAYDDSTSLKLTNNKASEAELSFKYTHTCVYQGKDTYSFSKTNDSTVAGMYKTTLAAGESMTITLSVAKKQGFGTVDRNGSNLLITDINLVVNDSVSVSFAAAQNGSYAVTNADGTAVDLMNPLATQSVTPFNLVATPDEGYAFSGWYLIPEGSTEEVFISGINPASNILFTQSGTLMPKFVPISGNIWGIGSAVFNEFDDAVAAARSGGGVVVLLKNLVVTTDMEIPAGVTVLIPFDDAHTVGGRFPEVLKSPDNMQTPKGAYRTLTLTNGAKLTVRGNLEVGAKHHASHGGQVEGGTPYDYYGHIIMENGTSIEVQNGGKLYAWGYITGTDEAIAAGNVTASVTAKSGAEIYEKMQVSDYRGGNRTTFYLVANNIFPFNQYYIQNVEVPETIESGASLICHAGIYADGIEAHDVDFMGGDNDAMFSMAAGSTVTKRYDHKTDRLIMDVDGNISMHAITIMDYDTSAFTLPLNNNLTINIHSGKATLAQDIMLLPGSRINVDQDAEVELASGKKLYLIDESNWGLYCFTKQIQQISYVPYYGGYPNIRQQNNNATATVLGDATLDINGTCKVSGSVYTSENGAQIISSDDTGVISLGTIPGNTTIKQDDQSNNITIKMIPAKLTNGDGSTLDTKGMAANTTVDYCAECNAWDVKAVVNFMSHDGNQLGDGTYFDCQQPEYKGETPTKIDDEKYINYEFLGWTSSLDTNEEKTVYSSEELPNATQDVVYTAYFEGSPKPYEITWLNEDGSQITSEEVGYGLVPEFKGETPVKEYTGTDDCHAYKFVGWSATQGGEALDAIPAVTGVTSYYAVFELVNTETHRPDVFDFTNNNDGTHKKFLKCCGEVVNAAEACADTDNDHLCDAEGCQAALTTCKDNLNHEQGKASDCAVDGWYDYYSCSICGKYYEDENATSEIEDLEAWKLADGKIPAAHNYGELIEAKDEVHTPTKLEAAVAAHYLCACGKYFDAAFNETSLEALTADAPEHSHDHYGVNDEQGKHWSICECGVTIGEMVDHDFTDGDCICGTAKPATNVTVVDKTNGVVSHTVDGNVVTVTYSVACKVGYLVDGSYVAINAVANADGSYSFTVPEGETEAILVVKGDLNSNAEVNTADKTLLARALLPTSNKLHYEMSAEEIFAADVNDTIELNTADKTLIARSLLPTSNRLSLPLAWIVE